MSPRKVTPTSSKSMINLDYHDQIYGKYFRYLNLERRGNVLNIGCASFFELANILNTRLHRRYREIVVCDASQELIECGEKYFQMDGINFVHFDIENHDGIPLEMKGKYDHLFSSYTLDILKDFDQIIKNSYDLLSKHGDLLFIFAKYEPAFTTYQEMTKNPKWLPYLKKYVDYSAIVEKLIGTKEKIIKWFEMLRFKCVVVSIDANEPGPRTKEELLEIADCLDVDRNLIPEADLDSYKEEYHRLFLNIDAVNRSVIDNEEVWTLKLPTVTVVAKK